MVLGEEAMRVGCEPIASEALVDHQDLSMRAAELKRCRQPGVAASDDDDVVDRVAHDFLLLSRNNISVVKKRVKSHGTSIVS